jgi:hypothetical protein
MLGGAVLGAIVRVFLPGHHLNSDSRDVAKLGAGLIATQAALVLGLLVSSAKSSFDTANAGITQSGARVILMDHILERYGPQTQGVRETIRHGVRASIERLWPQSGAGGLRTVESANDWGDVADQLRELAPETESQKLLKTQCLQLAADQAQLRWQLIEQSHGALPTVFLVVLIFWFTVLFAMFGVLTPTNMTVGVVILVCGLSVAGGVLLILEMNRPLEGLIRVSVEPLENALRHLEKR